VADELVRVTVVENEPAAEIASSALRADGIESIYRQTNFAAGTMDGTRGGAQEILVRPADLERAREILGGTA